jgi:hypothetical protein
MAKFRRQPLELPRKNYQLGNKDRFVFWWNVFWYRWFNAHWF